MMRRLFLTTLLAAGCSGGSNATGVSDDAFIDTIVELRTAALEDPGGYSGQKQQILQENGVTEDALRAYIQLHSNEPQHLATIWDRINARLTEPADTVVD